jgi:hypothetical protein
MLLCLYVLVITSLPVQAQKAAEAPRQPSLAKPLDELLAGQRPLESVVLEVKLLERGKESSVTIHGDGLAIHWQGKQFRLSREKRLDLLRLLKAGKFVAMPEHLPELPDGVEPASGPSRISLQIGTLSKVVDHRNKDLVNDNFVRLAKDLLAMSVKESAAGVGIDSLADGLQRVLERKLDARAMRIEVRYRRHLELCILEVEGHAARIYGQGYAGHPFQGQKPLTAEQLTAFVKKLQAEKFPELPRNVQPNADFSFSITVRVLDKERFVGGWRVRIFEKSFDENWEKLERLWKASEPLEPRRIYSKRKW